ncbi:MAG: four helix bundle protein [Candidatus Omnitrophica bacterium]|nr:four helix bundle protein [Candidatus Omnitrophota bacterium]MBU1047400.1 four helix bundle protein [Candidatus Omnitrophota bacterium]MBU1889018.1 four helix bundle protein [Candidatus Omnitrophota bacterium]
MKDYIPLSALEVYKLSRELSEIAWQIYETLNWQDKKIMGDQFIESVDSVGANIAEGYKRYHYLDRIKFYYNSRASLSESCNHWLELLYERKNINPKLFEKVKKLEKRLSIKLANFINTTYKSKNGE